MPLQIASLASDESESESHNAMGLVNHPESNELGAHQNRNSETHYPLFAHPAPYYPFFASSESSLPVSCRVSSGETHSIKLP